MRAQFTYWQDAEHFVGFLNEFPDYWTQGEDLEDLKAHLADLHEEFTSGKIPGVRRVAELEIA
ncbi:MAG: type II toxin-antitoxin system HicB family antitoxin [Verrucomicrobiota bacterium]